MLIEITLIYNIALILSSECLAMNEKECFFIEKFYIFRDF